MDACSSRHTEAEPGARKGRHYISNCQMKIDSPLHCIILYDILLWLGGAGFPGTHKRCQGNLLLVPERIAYSYPRCTHDWSEAS
jgi:hypothetical protein